MATNHTYGSCGVAKHLVVGSTLLPGLHHCPMSGSLHSITTHNLSLSTKKHHTIHSSSLDTSTFR